jgi:hypothetical protein
MVASLLGLIRGAGMPPSSFAPALYLVEMELHRKSSGYEALDLDEFETIRLARNGFLSGGQVFAEQLSVRDSRRSVIWEC